MISKRVLVADDESHMLRVVKLFLERAGYRVDTACNGQEALEAILRDPPDVLLTDIDMPRMSGKELCLELQKRVPDRKFPIFVMTSMTERENRDWAQKMTNTALLEKPVSMRALVAALAERLIESPAAPARPASPA